MITCSLGRFRESLSLLSKGKHPREISTTIKFLFTFTGEDQTYNTNKQEWEKSEIGIHTTSTQPSTHLYKSGPTKGTREKPKSLPEEEETPNQSQPRGMVLRINSIYSKTFDLQDNPADQYPRILTKEVNIQEFCFKRLLLAPPDNWHLESTRGLFLAPLQGTSNCEIATYNFESPAYYPKLKASLQSLFYRRITHS